jgi:branched-chain amino acid transport system ATP-binding protein
MEATENSHSAETQPLLDLRGVSVAFGGLLALSEIDLRVGLGERLAILGPNGAGKTTLFNVIAGDISPTTGTVHIAGDDVTLKPSRVRPALGVARTYQKTRLFADLSVAENLTLAAMGKDGRHRRLLHGATSTSIAERSRAAADKVWLSDVFDTLVADLSHGQRRQLEVGMAVVTEPLLMLLDEPASGLSRGERERLIDLLEDLEHTMTLILIEHDMDVALRVAERVMVMSDGRKLSEGTPETIREDPVVHAIYLGTRA